MERLYGAPKYSGTSKNALALRMVGAWIWNFCYQHRCAQLSSASVCEWILGCIRRKERLPSPSVLKEHALCGAGICVEACKLGCQNCESWTERRLLPGVVAGCTKGRNLILCWPCCLVNLALGGIRLSVWSLGSSSLGLLTSFGYLCSCDSRHVEPCFLMQWLILQPGIQNLKH